MQMSPSSLVLSNFSISNSMSARRRECSSPRPCFRLFNWLLTDAMPKMLLISTAQSRQVTTTSLLPLHYPRRFLPVRPLLLKHVTLIDPAPFLQLSSLFKSWLTLVTMIPWFASTWRQTLYQGGNWFIGCRERTAIMIPRQYVTMIPQVWCTLNIIMRFLSKWLRMLSILYLKLHGGWKLIWTRPSFMFVVWRDLLLRSESWQLRNGTVSANKRSSTSLKYLLIFDFEAICGDPMKSGKHDITSRAPHSSLWHSEKRSTVTISRWVPCCMWSCFQECHGVLENPKNFAFLACGDSDLKTMFLQQLAYGVTIRRDFGSLSAWLVCWKLWKRIWREDTNRGLTTTRILRR